MTDPAAGTPSPATVSEPEGAVPPKGLLLGYASGSLSMGVWVTLPGLLLLFFLTNVTGASPALAGLALFLPKIIDIVTHPWFGTLSDRQRRRRGNRRRMMWIGLLLSIAMVFTFSVPASIAGAGAALWVAGFYIAGNLLFASFQVPYLTIPSDLEISYFQRTRVMTYRNVLLTIGLLIVGTIAPLLVKSGERVDYVRMAAVMGIAMIVFGAIAIKCVSRLGHMMSPPTGNGQAHMSLTRGVKQALSDRNFRMLVLSYLLTVSVTHIFLAGAPYYAKYHFNSAGLASLLVGSFLGPAVIAGPIWMMISKRIGKQRGILICQATFAVCAALMFFGPKIGLVPTLAIVVVLGISFSGMQLFAYSMLPDVARSAGRESSQAASFTGVWTATEATGTAFGPYIYSVILVVGGFVGSTSDENVTQTPAALNALLVGFTLVPALVMFCAFLIQRNYRLDSIAREG